MFRIEDVLQLKDREEVRHLTRRHVLTMVPQLILALVLIVAPFFLMFPLFSWGIAGMVLFFCAVLLGISLALRTLLLWDADILIVTSQRLVDVDQRGIFTRIVTETPLDTIQDVSWSRRGMVQTLFRFGNVKVQTAGATANCEAVNIPQPQAVHELINELRQRVAPRAAPATSPVPPIPGTDGEDRRSKLTSIQAMLEKYPFEELKRIETVLKARERASVADAFFAGELKTEE